jgi:hypothetical protein
MVQGPYKRVSDITKHDTNAIGVPCEAISADTGGALIVVDYAGVTSTVTLVAGQILEFSPRIIKTGGVATGLHAWCR